MGYLKIFVYILLAALVAACTLQKGKSSGSKGIVGIKWQLIELNGEEVAETINGKTPYLELLPGEKRYAANGGCNNIGGTYGITGKNGITFSQGFSTKMACGQMDVEDALLRLLPTVASFNAEAEELVLMDDQNLPIGRFKKMNDTL